MSKNPEAVANAIVTGEYKVIDGKPQEERKPLKIILLGDSAVGKSKLVERFLMHRYIPIQMSTYALTLFKYDFQVEGGVDISTDVWDTAGQERFSSMRASYYHEAQCCILVFDITRKPTYKNLDKWYQELRTHRPHIPCIVACNKIDTDPSVISKTFNFAEKNELPLQYVSAADGTNVVQLFRTALAAAYNYSLNPHDEDVDTQVISLLKEQIALAHKEQELKSKAQQQQEQQQQAKAGEEGEVKK